MGIGRIGATKTHMSCGITQFYQPPDRGDVPAITKAGTRFIDPGRMKGRVDQRELEGYYATNRKQRKELELKRVRDPDHELLPRQ